MVGEQEKSVGSDGTSPKLGSVAFVDDCLRGQAFDPREWGSVGEAEVIGEQEDEVLVVGSGGEKGGSWLGLMTEVVVVTRIKIA